MAIPSTCRDLVGCLSGKPGDNGEVLEGNAPESLSVATDGRYGCMMVREGSESQLLYFVQGALGRVIDGSQVSATLRDRNY